jgi:hypothetical protein
MPSATTAYRLAVATAVATVLLLLFGIGALGVIGEGGRPDRVYLAVFAVLAVGTVLARLRAGGMALVLAATAFTQVLVAVVALLAGLPEGASVVDLAGITAMYAGLFALSAWLFRRAAEQRTAVDAEHPA